MGISQLAVFEDTGEYLLVNVYITMENHIIIHIIST